MNNPINKNISQETFSQDGFIVLKDFLHTDEISIVQDELEMVIECGRESFGTSNRETKGSCKSSRLKMDFRLYKCQRTSLRCFVVASGLVVLQHPVSFKKATSQIALMCYLTCTSKQNGALRVLPGSHHTRTELHSSLPEAHGNTSNQNNREDLAMRDQHEQITLNLEAGDAIAIDYRLLHGTHANSSAFRRDCVMLTFTPSWKELPEDIKGHLINHYALPFCDELPVQTVYQKDLLPSFEGIRKDLDINRIPPVEFEITE